MRINFFAGPGAGKSTTTARIFSELKERKISVEHVGEYVKAWAYQKRHINKWDQVYIFGKQQQYEYRYLSQEVKNIVTDSPCLLSSIYSSFYKSPEISKAVLDLCREYDKDHPCLNIFLDRGDKSYVQEGRYQSLDGAKELDSYILYFLERYCGDNLVKLNYADKAGILKAVLEAVEK